jgi:hypothetical protein
MIIQHDNIEVRVNGDQIAVVVDFGDNYEVRFHAGTVCELVEKLCEHRQHPQVRALADRLLPTLRGSSR